MGVRDEKKQKNIMNIFAFNTWAGALGLTLGLLTGALVVLYLRRATGGRPRDALLRQATVVMFFIHLLAVAAIVGVMYLLAHGPDLQTTLEFMQQLNVIVVFMLACSAVVIVYVFFVRPRRG